MMRKTLACAVLAMAVSVPVLTAPAAHAAPPTVVPSPGYDARLREARSMRFAAPPSTLRAPLPRASRHHRHKRSASQ
jgi:hypothetical protein